MAREPNYDPDLEILRVIEKRNQTVRKEEARTKVVAAKEEEVPRPPLPPMPLVQEPMQLEDIMGTVRIKVPQHQAAAMVDKHAEEIYNQFINIINDSGDATHPGVFLAVEMLAMEIRQTKNTSLLHTPPMVMTPEADTEEPEKTDEE